MKTTRQVCVPRPATFDPDRRDTVLDLTDLIEDRIAPREFFAENHVTEGMQVLLTEGFRRLEGKSSQGVFKLTQAMGGGKTHNLLALGLLARHPEFRAPVMGGFYTPQELGPVRVAAFTGRETDAEFGVWGAIAGRLGKKERLANYYAPLAAPSPGAWVDLLQGDPLVIMLDELPPYFEYAASRSIGNSDLSVVTATALANLLVAVGREELDNVAVVLSDLTASYEGGSGKIAGALREFEKETGRVAMNLEPVRMNTDEFYEILRTRLFESLPDATDIAAVAQGYAQAVREARQMDVTTASPEQFANRVAASYPFHPATRDLYARFRENQGFQQTRGLIRLMRIIVSRIWSSDRDPYLIAVHDLDLADQETLTEVRQINPTFGNAIAHDITASGGAVAEVIDTNRADVTGAAPDAQDVMRLLLVASLASVPGAVKGLAVPDVIANLCAPGRDVSGLKNEVIGRLLTAAWYLHAKPGGRLEIRNVQNLIARVHETAGAYLRDQALRELKSRIAEIFKPANRWCYQDVAPLPAVDALDPVRDRVTLVVCEPDPAGLSPALRQWYEQLTYRNRVLFLTGSGEQSFGALLNRARELRAVDQIIEELALEGLPDSDPQMQQARDQLRPRFLTQFHSAIRETFTTLYYPTAARLGSVDFSMEFRDNRYDGEQQVVDALRQKMKYTEDIASETFRKKAEQRLFTQQTMLWSEVLRRAATEPVWQWHRPDALERLKDDAILRDHWREEGQYVNKGPFPKPAATVRIQEVSRDEDTGAVALRVAPVHGDRVHVEEGSPAGPDSPQIEGGGHHRTSALRVSFLGVDSTGGHETGDPVEWTGRITLKSRVFLDGDERRVEIRAAPEAPIRYTTDGSDPKTSGHAYEGPFPVVEGIRLVLAVAERDGVESELHQREITEAPEERPIDRAAPAVWEPKQAFRLRATAEVYAFLDRIKKYAAGASGLHLFAQRGPKTWGEMNFSPDLEISGAALEENLDRLRSVVQADQVELRAQVVRFASGQRFLDWIHESEQEYEREDVTP